jgi:hypothetical protein
MLGVPVSSRGQQSLDLQSVRNRKEEKPYVTTGPTT